MPSLSYLDNVAAYSLIAMSLGPLISCSAVTARPQQAHGQMLRLRHLYSGLCEITGRKKKTVVLCFADLICNLSVR
jgi:hypothetical protein